MSGNSWLIISIVVALAVLALAAVFIKRNRGQPTEPDYRAFFVLGICWMPLGAATENYAFFVMGLVFMGLGLANRDKWREDSNMSPTGQRVLYLLIALVGLVALLALAIAAYGRMV
jgi:flagellar basal body-associated protein FliL